MKKLSPPSSSASRPRPARWRRPGRRSRSPWSCRSRPAAPPTSSPARCCPSLNKTFGQSFIVDNKAGATGTIGAAAVKRAPADGYTFLVTSLGPLVIAPHLIKGMQYDALDDFDPITVAVQAPNVLVVPAGLAAQVARRRDRVREGQPRQDDLRLLGQRLERPPHGRAVLARERHHRPARALQGRRPGDHRPARRPGRRLVPERQRRAAAHQGRQAPARWPSRARSARRCCRTCRPWPRPASENVDVYSWQGVVGPKGLPADVRTKFHEAVVAALNEPQTKQQLTALGLEVVANTPAQFAAFQQQEFARWKKVIEVAQDHGRLMRRDRSASASLSRDPT